MRLSELIAERTDAASGPDPEILGVTADSRKAGPGFLFAALAGAKTDGARFAAQAVAAGAAAVLVGPGVELPGIGVPVIVSPEPRRALAIAAARFFGAQPETIVAVTGTSGKTSVADFTRQIWTALGHRAASIGTIGVIGPDGGRYGSLTTPDPVDLARDLAKLAADGVTHVALEASSHGLDQHRLDGVRISVGAFTNLSRDHLDYHPSLEAYFDAKMRLAEQLLPWGATMVIAADGPDGARVADRTARAGRVPFTVGADGTGLWLVSSKPDADGQRLMVTADGIARKVRLPLIGTFQVSNALVAAGLAIASGSPAVEVLNALEGLKGAPGRLELVGRTSAGAPVFVDYSHKPDALDKALAALRPSTDKRLIVVFGCGGDRDAGKRPLMGEIATRAADVVIVTDDNPRSEDPATIRRAILAAAPGALEIGDRGAAIRHAIGLLHAGDCLMVAGKGHETGQIVGQTTLPFSDHDCVVAALRDLGS